MRQEFIPQGYEIKHTVRKNRVQSLLIDKTRPGRPISLTNRHLSEVDSEFGGHLFEILQEKRTKALNGSINILDCPSGREAVAASEIASAYPGIKVFAVDLMANTKFQGSNFLNIQGKIGQLPIADASIDLVYCFAYLIYHMKEKQLEEVNVAMSEIARVLAPGGCALVGIEYGQFIKHFNKDRQFESQTKTLISHQENGLDFPTKLLNLIMHLHWFDNKFVLMQKLPLS